MLVLWPNHWIVQKVIGVEDFSLGDLRKWGVQFIRNQEEIHQEMNRGQNIWLWKAEVEFSFSLEFEELASTRQQMSHDQPQPSVLPSLKPLMVRQGVPSPYLPECLLPYDNIWGGSGRGTCHLQQKSKGNKHVRHCAFCMSS